MKHVVRTSDVSRIRKLAQAGLTAHQISIDMAINLDRIEAFMPKDPEIEAVEKKVQAAARAKTKAIDDEKPLTKAARKRRNKGGNQ